MDYLAGFGLSLGYIGLGLEKYSNYLTAAGLILDILDLDLKSSQTALLELIDFMIYWTWTKRNTWLNLTGLGLILV